MEVPDDATSDPTRNEQRTLFAVLAAIAVFLTLHAFWGRWHGARIEIERLPERRFDFQLDLNDALVVELMQLPGIGKTLAERIVEDRRLRGEFQTVDDLQRVKGIGPKLTERLRPYVFVKLGDPDEIAGAE